MIAGFLLAGVIFFAVQAWAVAVCCEARLPRAEKFLRSRRIGAVAGAAALLWCVPQVQAVAWHWLAQWAYPAAAAVLFLSVKYLDNLVARAWAGLLIMGAYSFLDMSFDQQLNMGISGAIPAWVWGSIGIVAAAKPCYVRDFLRLSSRKKFWRLLAVILSVVTAIFLLTALAVFMKSRW